MTVFCRLFAGLLAVGALAAATGSCVAQPAVAYADQNQNPVSWTHDARKDFYSTDQGSRMIPLSWFMALRKTDGASFLADGLASYGYLANPDSPDGLPVGFTAAVQGDEVPAGKTLGMTCAACHTRQISVGGQAIRIDGGPAFADFERLMRDLDNATNKIASDDAAYADFAKSVLGATASATAKADLRTAFHAWQTRFHTIMRDALPVDAAGHWGPARLDAVSMIFNRIMGLDIGTAANHIESGNIQRASAPVRYPFLWNANKQDKTQWPGFAPNGDDILALVRNVGQVMGVFGEFSPSSIPLPPPLPTLAVFRPNSVNFDGIWKIESLIARIGPPAWRWTIDETLRRRGEEVFSWPTAQGGCAECHQESPGIVRAGNPNTWATCIANVGTDLHEWDILGRTGKSGRLEGVLVPGLPPKRLGEQAGAVDIMMAAVSGVIADQLLRPDGVFRDLGFGLDDAIRNFAQDPVNLLSHLPPPLDELQLLNNDKPGAYAGRDASKPDCNVKQLGYEARVLKGVWAAAPYLHDGSVPTLADLLKPSAQRPKSFAIGPNYDIATVGLAAQQAPGTFTLTVTGCEDLHSGRSNCGHEYGVSLSDADRTALLEYLKAL